MAQKDYTAVRDDYKTPPEIYYTLLQIAGPGRTKFGTDVCCSETNIPAYAHYRKEHRDGLSYEWNGVCFMNPPFRPAQKWVRKAVESVKKNNAEVYAVLPADRLETKYYQECILQNPHCCFAFLPGKVGFIIPGQESEEIIPSQKIMIAIFSKRAAEIASNWKFYGWFNTTAFQGEEAWTIK